MTTSRSTFQEAAGPLRALTLPLLAVLALALTGCGSVGDCVQVYQFEGTVRKDGYTRAECEDECAQIGRTLSCAWEGGIMAPPAIVSRRDDPGSDRTAAA